MPDCQIHEVSEQITRDVGPTLNQHWFNDFSLLCGSLLIGDITTLVPGNNLKHFEKVTRTPLHNTLFNVVLKLVFFIDPRTE